MRRIFLLFIALSSLVLSEVVFSNIDECKTDVYFGNGILTKEGDAEDNAKLLEKAIKQKIGRENFDKKIGKVDYAYNDTFEIGQDMFESEI